MRNTLLRLLYHLLRLTRPRTQTPPHTILILQYQMPLGCCVHGTPIYAAIKQNHPNTTIIVATRGLGFATLQHDPHIDHLIATDNPVASRLAAFRVAKHLRRELNLRNLTPDLILQDASNRAGTYALFAAMLRLAPTAGFADASPLYDTHLAYDNKLSLIDNNLRLPYAGSTHREPAVYFTAEDLATAGVLLTEANPNDKPLTAFVLQGSGGQRTSWHDDRFATIIAYVESIGHQTIFLGTPSDAPAIDRIRFLAHSTGTSLAGRTTIPQLAAVLTLCDLLVSVDTGTMHVGRAAGLPMVVLGPSWQKPLEWLPISLPQVRILRGPDQATVPPDYRLDEITVSDVAAAIDELVQLFPPKVESRTSRVHDRLRLVEE